jgi:hypothetical protein
VVIPLTRAFLPRIGDDVYCWGNNDFGTLGIGFGIKTMARPGVKVGCDAIANGMGPVDCLGQALEGFLCNTGFFLINNTDGMVDTCKGTPVNGTFRQRGWPVVQRLRQSASLEYGASGNRRMTSLLGRMHWHRE